MGKQSRTEPPKPRTAAEIRETAQGNAGSAPKRPKLRTYSAEYKLRVLVELEALATSGEVGAQGAFLRREGLVWSHIHRWRKERDQGGVAALEPKKRGPASSQDPVADENARLRRQNERLRNELRKAEIIIDVQKKLAALLGVEVPVPPAEEEP